MTEGNKGRGSERGARFASLLAWSACGLILLTICVFVALSVPNGWPFRSLAIGVVSETVAALVGGSSPRGGRATRSAGSC